MSIRCRQNAPDRTMRVASKSYSFCFSFRWGFRLQRTRAARASPSRQIEAKSLGETRQVARGRCEGRSRQPMQANRGRSRQPAQANRAKSTSLGRSRQPARAHRARSSSLGRSRQPARSLGCGRVPLLGKLDRPLAVTSLLIYTISY